MTGEIRESLFLIISHASFGGDETMFPPPRFLGAAQTFRIFLTFLNRVSSCGLSISEEEFSLNGCLVLLEHQFF